MIAAFKKNNLSKFFVIFAIFKFITIFLLDINAVPEHLTVRWQLLDTKLLEEHLFSSLLNMHYQPPLWNLIYGIFIKIFGSNFDILARCIQYFNIIISFISIYYFYLICDFLKIDNTKKIITFLIFFIFSPGYLFYETITHYTHLTTLLFAQVVYFFLKFSEKKSFKYEILIYFISLILVYTWTAFSHPLFIGVIFVGIILIKFTENFIKSLLIFLIVILLSILPSLKNKIKFDVFANSSWAGLQIIQVLQNWDNYNRCNFIIDDREKEEEKFKKKYPEIDINHPSLIGSMSRFNHVAFIDIAKTCTEIGINLIKKDPLFFLNKVKFNFISTHGHFSFDHVGWEPTNWIKYYGFFDKLKENKFTNQLKVRSLQLYYFSMYLFFIILTLRNVLSINKKSRYFEKSLSSIFLIYFWLILIIHFGAGFEQERMRHTGHFLHIIFFILIIQNWKNPITFLKKYFFY
jgi:hypothetical protein